MEESVFPVSCAAAHACSATCSNQRGQRLVERLDASRIDHRKGDGAAMMLLLPGVAGRTVEKESSGTKVLPVYRT